MSGESLGWTVPIALKFAWCKNVPLAQLPGGLRLLLLIGGGASKKGTEKAPFLLPPGWLPPPSPEQRDNVCTGSALRSHLLKRVPILQIFTCLTLVVPSKVERKLSKVMAT